MQTVFYDKRTIQTEALKTNYVNTSIKLTHVAYPLYISRNFIALSERVQTVYIWYVVSRRGLF